MKNRILSISLAVVIALSVGLIGCTAEVPQTTEYTLTISSTEGGEITSPGEATSSYDEGATVPIVAFPHAGYRFVNWTGDVSTVANVNSASTTITMEGNCEITANFEAVPPDKYSLTISSTTGGSVTSPGPGTFTYDKGTIVNLVATPTSGYQFIKWTGNVDTIANTSAASTTIIMDGYYTVTADFGIAIYDWYDLDAMRDNLSGSYILMNNLDSTTAGYTELVSQIANAGQGWQPIGSIIDDQAGNIFEFVDPFTGTFDGQWFEIRDLFVSRPEQDGIGLFGSIHSGGIIRNVGVVNARVIGRTHVGSLVGVSWGGSVSNSYSTGSVTGTNQFIGGLVGSSYDAVSDSYSMCSVAGSGVGGLVGAPSGGIVNNSHYDYDEVLINGQHIITIGALFHKDFDEWLANGKFLDVDEELSQEDGYYLINNVNDFKRLLAYGQDSSLKFRLTQDLDLANEPNLYIPYLAGEFDGNGHKVSNLTLHYGFVEKVGLFGYLAPGGKVTQVGVENVNVGATSGIGGLAGVNDGTISNSYSTGSVTGSIAGGLVGEGSGVVNNSYSKCSVSGGWRAGGLIGWNHGPVSNSHSTGSVTGWDAVGGLVGLNTGTVSNSFWNTATSGYSTSDGGIGKTTTEMKSIATFSGAGWNITAVANPGTRNTAYMWNIVDGETYPFLSWQS